MSGVLPEIRINRQTVATVHHDGSVDLRQKRYEQEDGVVYLTAGELGRLVDVAAKTCASMAPHVKLESTLRVKLSVDGASMERRGFAPPAGREL
jgi:hypothetical protein